MLYTVMIQIHKTGMFTGTWRLVAHSQSYTFHTELE